MKHYKKIVCGMLAIAALLASSCDNLLDEEPRSDIVPAFFKTPAGILGGIAGVYDAIRGAYGTEGHTLQQMSGTDEHLMGTSASGPQFFTYNGILPAHMNAGFNVYTSINTLNGILELGPAADIPAATKTQYLAQAKFLRAFLYFDLVQVYGDVPLHTTFITVPTAADSKAPVEQVYELIIQDLSEAAQELPNIPTAPFLGKAATKGTALYLLAKVYLTRGWLTNNNADFTKAYAFAADSLIAQKGKYGLDLWQNYADAFNKANDYGKENIFVSDHSNDVKFGRYQAGASGGPAQNVVPWMHRFNYVDNVAINATIDPSTGLIKAAGQSMLFRDVAYGRPYTRIRPNTPKITTGANAGKSYIYDQAFADRVNDSRYSNTFQTVYIANKQYVNGVAQSQGAYNGQSGATGTRGTLICGIDTAVWFADYEVPGAPQAFGARPFKGIIVTPNMQSPAVYPTMKKFDDPTRAAPNDPSTRPVVLYRFSDAYLIAAEAAFKLGNLQQAADMINVVRIRAAFRTSYPVGVTQASAEAAQTIGPDDVTLDFILDERTREFYGESQRRTDLVRTKALISRVTAWNPVEAGANIKPYHILRPIPQDQIDRVTEGDCQGAECWQNIGYF